MRPGKAGPMELKERYFMKFGQSSSGCETRPTKAKPGRLEASLAHVAVTEHVMRRYANEWAAGYQPRKLYCAGVPRGFATLKAAVLPT